MSNDQQNNQTVNTRRKAVKDAVIMREVILASKINEEGKITGTLETVAQACGMTKGALGGRLTQMRNLGIPIPELGRCSGGGVGKKKKNAQDMLDLFNELNEEMSDDADDADDAKNLDDVMYGENSEHYEDV
jgi:hypothetical protein